MTLEQKYRAMLDGWTLADDRGRAAWYDRTHGYRYTYEGVARELTNPDLSVFGWRIEPRGGWLPWYGGNEPPCEGRIEVRQRNNVNKVVDVKWALWGHHGTADDIIAYRPIPVKMSKAEAAKIVAPWAANMYSTKEFDTINAALKVLAETEES